VLVLRQSLPSMILTFWNNSSPISIITTLKSCRFFGLQTGRFPGPRQTRISPTPQEGPACFKDLRF
jgi:hypothetical protein